MDDTENTADAPLPESAVGTYFASSPHRLVVPDLADPATAARYRYVQRIATVLALRVFRSRACKIISGSGLFDTQYYQQCYGGDLRQGQDPILHYLERGESLGFRPGPDFDPMLYKMQLGSRVQHPLLECVLAHRQKLRLQPLRSVRSFFPAILLDRTFMSVGNSERTEEDVIAYRQSARELMTSPPIEIDHPPYKFSFRNISPDTLFSRLLDNVPVSMVRLPHGTWDSFASVEKVAGLIALSPNAAGLSQREIMLLAVRRSREQWPANGLWMENVYDETMTLIHEAANSKSNDLMVGLALRAYPTIDGNPFPRDDVTSGCVDRLRIIASLFGRKRAFYDATLFKRWAIAGAFGNLPRLLRDHPVILIGPHLFKGLKERWQHPDFTYIPIEKVRTQQYRHRILAEINATIQEKLEMVKSTNGSAKKPVVIFQCGASLAFWFTMNLRRLQPDSFYLDFGQALNIWVLDIMKPFFKGWTSVYWPEILKNNNLGIKYKEKVIKEAAALGFSPEATTISILAKK